MNYINETANNLAKNIRGLSEEQFQFKPTPEPWSISQCVEHIIATDVMLLDKSKANLQGSPNSERKS
ncbi:MAG: DinB family protein [Flavobacteriales bacterium]|nr:DinB family protein [Flavobacteriales bacterium]